MAEEIRDLDVMKSVTQLDKSIDGQSEQPMSIVISHDQNRILRIPNRDMSVTQQTNLHGMLTDIHLDPEGFKQCVRDRRMPLSSARSVNTSCSMQTESIYSASGCTEYDDRPDTERSSVSGTASPSTHTGINGEGSIEDYDIFKVIGKGKFSTVHYSERKQDSEPCAMKRVELPSVDLENHPKYLKEVRLLQGLRHPNIIQYLDSFLDSNTLYIVLEWAGGGDLKRLLNNVIRRKARLSEQTIWAYFCQCCEAVKHMHDHRVIHRDIKPANVFVMPNGRLKLGDLGLSRALHECSLKAFSQVGTPLYMSPEVLRGEGHDFASDIWSMGCVLYEFAMLNSPFEKKGLSMFELFQKIMKGSYPEMSDFYSQEMRDLVDEMINLDPLRRPDIDEVAGTGLLIRTRTPTLEDSCSDDDELIQDWSNRLSTEDTEITSLEDSSNHLQANEFDCSFGNKEAVAAAAYAAMTVANPNQTAKSTERGRNEKGGHDLGMNRGEAIAIVPEEFDSQPKPAQMENSSSLMKDASTTALHHATFDLSTQATGARDSNRTTIGCSNCDRTRSKQASNAGQNSERTQNQGQILRQHGKIDTRIPKSVASTSHSQTYPPSSKQVDAKSYEVNRKARKHTVQSTTSGSSKAIIPDDGSGDLEDEEQQQQQQQEEEEEEEEEGMESFRWNSVSNWADGCIYGVDGNDDNRSHAYSTPTDSVSASPQDGASGAALSHSQKPTQNQPRISPKMQTSKFEMEERDANRVSSRQSSSPARPFDDVYNEEEIELMDALITGTTIAPERTEEDDKTNDSDCRKRDHSNSIHSSADIGNSRTAKRNLDTACATPVDSQDCNDEIQVRQDKRRPGSDADANVIRPSNHEERVSGFSKMLGIFSRIRSNSRSNSKYRVHTM